MDIFKLAADHNCDHPVYDEAKHPQLFQCWADRVQQVAAMVADGRDAEAMRRDVSVYAGRPVVHRWPKQLIANQLKT